MSRPRKDRLAISSGCRKRKLNNNRVGVRLSKSEKDALEILANQADSTRAEYLRGCFLTDAFKRLPENDPTRLTLVQEILHG